MSPRDLDVLFLRLSTDGLTLALFSMVAASGLLNVLFISLGAHDYACNNLIMSDRLLLPCLTR